MKYIKTLELNEAAKPLYKKGQTVEYQLTHKGGVGKYANAMSKSVNIETGVIRKRSKTLSSFKYELTNGLELYQSEIIGLAESVINEKKFKPGDMWSDDFDYMGMLKYALKVNVNTPLKTLNALFDSATDVNYHTPFANLGIAIDWIEDGDKEGAKDYIKMFHKDIKKEL